MFPGTYFGFDICNPKLFALKNRSSLQNVDLIQVFTIFMTKNAIFEQMSKMNVDQCFNTEKNALISNLQSVLAETL